LTAAVEVTGKLQQLRTLNNRDRHTEIMLNHVHSPNRKRQTERQRHRDRYQ